MAQFLAYGNNSNVASSFLNSFTLKTRNTSCLGLCYALPIYQLLKIIPVSSILLFIHLAQYLSRFNAIFVSLLARHLPIITMRQFGHFGLAIFLVCFTAPWTTFAEAPNIFQLDSHLGHSNIEKRVPYGWFPCTAFEVMASAVAPGSNQGSTGIIYMGSARQPGTYAPLWNVAIKVVNIERAEEEYSTLPIPAARVIQQRFNHVPGVSSVYDTCELNGEQIVISELMYGQTVESLIKEGA